MNRKLLSAVANKFVVLSMKIHQFLVLRPTADDERNCTFAVYPSEKRREPTLFYFQIS